MNILRGLVVFIICVTGGIIMSTKYKRKRVFYSCFSEFNLRIKNQVAFSKDTIFNIINKIESENEFYKMVKEYFVDKDKKVDNVYLAKDDLNLFYDYLNTIGKGDRESQLQYLNAVGVQIEENRLKSVEIESKYKGLCIKIGVLLGLICFVILL